MGEEQKAVSAMLGLMIETEYEMPKYTIVFNDSRTAKVTASDVEGAKTKAYVDLGGNFKEIRLGRKTVWTKKNE